MTKNDLMCCSCLLIHESEIRHITSGLLVRLFIMFMMSFGGIMDD